MPTGIVPSTPTATTYSSSISFAENAASSSQDDMDSAAKKIANQAGDFGYGLGEIAGALVEKVWQLGEALHKFNLLPIAAAAEVEEKDEAVVYEESLKDFFKRIDKKISVKVPEGQSAKAVKFAFRQACKKIIAEEGNEDLVRYSLEHIDEIHLISNLPGMFAGGYTPATNTLKISCNFQTGQCNHVTLLHELTHFIELAQRQFSGQNFFQRCFRAINGFSQQVQSCLKSLTTECDSVVEMALGSKDRSITEVKPDSFVAGQVLTDKVGVAFKRKDEGHEVEREVVGRIIDGKLDQSRAPDIADLYAATKYPEIAANSFVQYENPQDAPGFLTEIVERTPHLVTAATPHVVDELCPRGEGDSVILQGQPATALEKYLQPAVITADAATRTKHNSRIIPNPPASLYFGKKKPNPATAKTTAQPAQSGFISRDGL